MSIAGRRPLLLACLLVHAVAVTSAAGTEEQAKGATTTPVKLITLDLAVPDSPAFAILGLSPDAVVKPASPRDIATTVLNGVDRRGNLQSGFGVDFVPLFLFGGRSVEYADYKGSAATRLLGRTQFSLATAKGAGEGDKAMRLATGLRTTLWDAGDPRLDDTLVRCLDDIPVPVPTTALLTQAARDAYVAKATAERRPAVEGCHKAFKARRWNAPSLAVGVAPSWHSALGETEQFTYAGAAVWASLALGLSRTVSTGGGNETQPFGQVIVQGRWRSDERVPDRNVRGTYFTQASAGAAARLMLGGADRAVVIESEIARQSSPGSARTTSVRLSGGGQLRLAADLWLSLAAGGTRGGPDNEQRGGFVLSSFKWALSRDPAIRMP